jgi:hypothetical protein
MCVTATKLTWGILGLLYLLFFGWYTSCEGPLTEEEMAHFAKLMKERAPDASPERQAIMREFMETDTGDDLVMWNVIDMHETPLQLEGVEPGETSAQVLAKYMQYMWPALIARACHPVVFGAAASPAPEMFGIEGARDWSQGVGMRYRSRRDLLEIATNPAFQGSHQFKIAAINKTFAFPADPWFHLGDPRLLLALGFLVIGCAVGWIGASRRA